jgi:acetyl esterase/lipase
MADFDKSVQALMSMISANHESLTDSGGTPVHNFSEEMFKVMALSIADGIAAMKYVRQHAADYAIDPNRVGMIGFSAGSGVELEVAMNGDPASVPNFAAHIYGGDTRGEKIPENAPPLFILSAADDDIAQSNPDLFVQWRAAGKSAELHIYSKGGHSFGMSKQGLPVDNWIERFGDWLRMQGLMEEGG